MMVLKIGVGIRTSELELLEEAKKLYDKGLINYIEIIVKSNLNTEQASRLCKLRIPLVIHGPYFSSKVNIADESLFEYNWQQVKQAYELAEKISAKYFILHPGFKDHLSKSFKGGPETTLTFLRKFKEIETKPKILLENNPYIGENNYRMYFSNPEEYKEIISLGIGICLDFRHAATVAANLNKPLNLTLQEFSKLNPKYSHISGGPLADKNEICTSFLEYNEYDWKLIKNLVDSTDSQMLTIETPRKSKTSLAENIRDLKIVSEEIR